MRGLLDEPPRVVNVGLEVFARELSGGLHVDWRPPAGALVGVLGRLLARSAEIDAANAEALARLVGGEPVLVDCRPAREAIDLPERTVLHAGPPIEWERMCAPLRPKERWSDTAETRERTLREARDGFERAYILAELKANDWNVTRASERLGIERSHLYRKIKAYGIALPK